MARSDHVNAVKHFWTDVVWEELDYLFIDMPRELVMSR